MGCGASTFKRDESGGAGGISFLYINPLHRDSPWRRKSARPAVDSNPSSKKLLVAATTEEDGSNSPGRKSVSVNPVSPKDEGGFMKEPPVQTMKEDVPIKKEDEEERPVIGGDRDHDDGKDDRRDVPEEEEKGLADDGSDYEEGLFFPRSPSFRYYCTPHDGNDDGDSSSYSSSDNDMNARIDEAKTESVLTRAESNKSRKDHDGGDAAPTIPAAPTAPAKLSSSQSLSTSKKPRKSAARRMCVALPKGNPATGMKSLLNAASCSPRRAAQVAS